jgi:hypothetical protein
MVGMIVFFISMLPFVGPVVGNLAMLFVSVYFICVWILFYFRFEKKLKKGLLRRH